jgi:hypothetical protein
MVGIMKITVFWDEIPCGLVDTYHHFRGTFNLNSKCRRIFSIGVASGFRNTGKC